jgi:molybdopterin-containing oxidoreductase family iron-sulfur binding subunit
VITGARSKSSSTRRVPRLVEREFPQQAEEWDDPIERRTFLKLMGASLALAGLSGCVYQPPEKIVAYVKQPEEEVPGKALFFATAVTLGGVATPVLVRSNEGRPTTVEGNPDHPNNRNADQRSRLERH